ncbi:MAG TPA: hypothetical protein VMY77_14535 [Chitinophagaceae bacterium]|nr:hypothetical protein [Chitinophagaceae bacterium]
MSEQSNSTVNMSCCNCGETWQEPLINGGFVVGQSFTKHICFSQQQQNNTSQPVSNSNELEIQEKFAAIDNPLFQEWRSFRTKAISEMFDKPDSVGIYPTTTFFNKIDRYVLTLIDAATENPVPVDTVKEDAEQVALKKYPILKPVENPRGEHNLINVQVLLNNQKNEAKREAFIAGAKWQATQKEGGEDKK